ncbi:hypothetical protein BpHYR1_050183 [Brachionus plicatilis]|uniref:Uncharacterized protein n=1 Tax=Brachionus plicatilis TaxID=10195 RepID=A0A3M7S0K3_BRAPC|nr:hypothetical protein BpHYR1_050183 [Brachionus plicatilis]
MHFDIETKSTKHQLNRDLDFFEISSLLHLKNASLEIISCFEKIQNSYHNIRILQKAVLFVFKIVLHHLNLFFFHVSPRKQGFMIWGTLNQ